MERYLETYEVAIEALEKTIAKKPLYKKKEHKDGKCYIKREYYICPYCGKKLFIQNHQEIKTDTYSELNRFPQGDRTKRCSDCGQATDWSEE